MSNTRPTVLATSTSRTRTTHSGRGGAKSRSPGPSRRSPLAPTDPFTPTASLHANSSAPKIIRRKKSSASLQHRTANTTPTGSTGNELVDRGTKLRLGSVTEVVQVTTSKPTRRKELRPRSEAPSSAASAIDVEQQGASTAATSEIERLNKEIELLRQALHESKKQNKKHSKASSMSPINHLC